MVENTAADDDGTARARARRVARAVALRERVSEDRQKAMLDRWIALAATGPVGRRALTPEMFGRALHYVDLIEVIEDGAEYSHVIEGREVMRRFGPSGREPFAKLYDPVYLGRLRGFYETVRMTGGPNLRRFAVQSVIGEEMAFGQLALPATDEDGAVSHIAVVFDFPDPIARIPTMPLMMHSAWRRLARGTDRETIPGDRLWR